MKSNINVLCNGAKSNGKYGLMDYNGNIIIEPKFDKVTINEPELAEYIKEIDSYEKIINFLLIILIN